MWDKGVRNNVYFFRMCLHLNDCQFKTSGYSYRATHMNPVVTTNQNLQQIKYTKTREKRTQE